MSSPRPTQEPPGGAPGWFSSVLALVLGLVLSVAVSALFSRLGWGGDLASQTAGATSGAAPLLMDAARNRHAIRRGQVGGGALGDRPDWPRKLLVVACFAFAYFLAESAVSWFVFHLTRWTLRLAHAGQDRFSAVFLLLGVVLFVPVVLVVLYLLALAAGRRLREHRRRWILLGVGIYAVARTLNVVAASDALIHLADPDASMSATLEVVAIAVAAVFVLGAVCLVALLGVRRARTTQAAYDASTFFRRLEPGDREAALALLDDAPAAPSERPLR